MLPFTGYMAEQAVWSLELAIKAAKGEDLEERKDWLKEAQELYLRSSGKPMGDDGSIEPLGR